MAFMNGSVILAYKMEILVNELKINLVKNNVHLDEEKLISFIKELFIAGLGDREISYSRYKEQYTKNYAKSTFFSNINKLIDLGFINEKLIKNRKFYSLSKKYEKERNK